MKGNFLSISFVVCMAVLIAGENVIAASEASLAAQKGMQGVVVYVGCGKGEGLTGPGAGRGIVVHGIDTDADDISAARVAIRKAGTYGPISADVYDGKHLPYGDNMVNRLIAEDLADVSMTEVMRVLAPRGIARIKRGRTWETVTKPAPANIDDWTHYLHGPDNNAVAKDTVVGPAYRTQWVAGPPFARSHEINSSMAAMISANGRLLYIWDDGPTGMTDKRFMSNWQLIARDAFNGIMLWKRPVPEWGWRQWHAESRWEDHHERADMLRLLPSTTPRRLVAHGDRIYVTLGYNAPVSVLDASSGKTLTRIAGTEMTDEILHIDGKLVLRVRTPNSPPEKDVWISVPTRSQAFVMAIDTKTQKILWRTKPVEMPPMTIAASGGRVYYSNYERIVCHAIDSGKELWRSEPVPTQTGHRGTVGTLVAQEQVVLFTTYRGGGKDKALKDATKLHALSAETGKVLWKSPNYVGPGISNPPDIFVAGGLVWIGESRSRKTYANVKLIRQGFNLLTGKVEREINVPYLISPGHHYRCYRSKATERFLILPKRGAEFVDLVGDNHMRHDWVRPPCIYGVLPANGLTYFPPNQCVCYQETLLSNFNALAPKATKPLPEPRVKLEKGPAFGKVSGGKKSTAKGDWPTYRHDAKRSGFSDFKVSDAVKERWQMQLSGRITPPVVAGNTLLVAEIDRHRVHAFGAETGKPLWQYTVGGRVDSPPTIHGSLALFGCADGYVYCLRLSDGALVWRFLAAPCDRRVNAFGQLESAWPVHGSVLVQDDTVYCTAGRSSFLDGGIYVYGLNVADGSIRYQTRLDGPHSDPQKDKGTAGAMDGAKSNILVSDGSDIYLFQERFGRDLKRYPSAMQKAGLRQYAAAPKRQSSGRRLITTHGFLCDTDNEGKYWTYSDRWPGWNRKMSGVIHCQLLAFDNKTLYGLQVFTENIRVRRGRHLGGKGQRLFICDLEGKKDRWSTFIKMHIKGLVVAQDKIVIAGTPNTIPDDDPLAGIEGRLGSMLKVVSAENGRVLSEQTLSAPPVFDGLIAAHGVIYVSTRDGKITALEGK